MGLGGPIGGILTDKLGWRSAFLCQVPFFLVSLLLTSYNLNYTVGVRTHAFWDFPH